MGAIVTVFKHTSGTEAARLVNELGRWADAASGVTFSHGGDVVDVTFAGDTDTRQARSMVEDVLGAANVTWSVHVGVEVVSTG